MATIDALRLLVWSRDGGICQICGDPVSLSVMHMDHTQTRSEGGPDSFENLRATHRLCNQRRPDAGSHGPHHSRPRTTYEPYALRINADLKAKLEEHARRDRRSLNAQIIYMLEQSVEREQSQT